jgi:putative flippase GtrA
VGPVERLLQSQATRFVVVGVGAALLLFSLSYLFIAAGMPPFAGSTLAYGIAFVCAYLAQRGWTFGGAHGHTHAFPRYLITQIGCSLVAGGAAHLSANGLGAPAAVVAALSTILASAGSFVLSRYWVFSVRANGPGGAARHAEIG